MGDTGYGNAWLLSVSRAALLMAGHRLRDSAMRAALQPSAIVMPARARGCAA